MSRPQAIFLPSLLIFTLKLVALLPEAARGLHNYITWLFKQKRRLWLLRAERTRLQSVLLLITQHRSWSA